MTELLATTASTFPLGQQWTIRLVQESNHEGRRHEGDGGDHGGGVARGGAAGLLLAGAAGARVHLARALVTCVAALALAHVALARGARAGSHNRAGGSRGAGGGARGGTGGRGRARTGRGSDARAVAVAGLGRGGVAVGALVVEAGLLLHAVARPLAVLDALQSGGAALAAVLELAAAHALEVGAAAAGHGPGPVHALAAALVVEPGLLLLAPAEVLLLHLAEHARVALDGLVLPLALLVQARLLGQDVHAQVQAGVRGGQRRNAQQRGDEHGELHGDGGGERILFRSGADSGMGGRVLSTDRGEAPGGDH
ncbi:hypothetical protein ON010_g9912 [Phytophthora cinnamomi]|nr:hypothetical protein ON010_g9912 [Phytophthora cinnamomi]